MSSEDNGNILFKILISFCPLWLFGIILLFAILAIFVGGSSEDNKNIDFFGKYPLPCDTAKISSDYGMRIHPVTGETKKHTGVDFTPEWHSKVYSIEDGVVYDTSINQAFGQTITIEHTTEDETFYSFYAHLSEVRVKKGDEVEQGEAIGLEGGDPDEDDNAGLSTGHHLHFEIRLEPQYGSDVNPKLYLKKKE